MLLSSKKLIIVVCFFIAIIFFVPYFLSSYAQNHPEGGEPPAGGNPPAGEDPPPATGEGGANPGGAGNEDCVCGTKVESNSPDCPGKIKVIRTCNNICDQSGYDCVADNGLGFAPLWTAVVSLEQPSNIRTYWKGSQDEDAVVIDEGNTQSWSVDPDDGGGLDDEGYFNLFRVFYGDFVAGNIGRRWIFDKASNHIDASGTMNIWIEDSVGYEEYWSNHFCGNGLAWYPHVVYYNSGHGTVYDNRDILATGNMAKGMGGGIPNGGVNPYCKLADGFDPDEPLTNVNPFCALDYDGCIGPFSGGKTCLDGSCKAEGFHDSINAFIIDANEGFYNEGITNPFNIGPRYAGAWAASFWMYGDRRELNSFEIRLRAPLGYLCKAGKGRRIADLSNANPGNFTKSTSTDFSFDEHGDIVYSEFVVDDDGQLVLDALGNPIPVSDELSGFTKLSEASCYIEINKFHDGGGKGINTIFTIEKDPNFNISGWYKIKDGSFHKKGNITATYPALVNKYDDIDDNGKVYPIIDADNVSNPGLTTLTHDTFIVSSNRDELLEVERSDNIGTTDPRVGKISSTNWRIGGYFPNSSFLSNLGNFLEVLRSQSSTDEISNINQITQPNRVYIYDTGSDLDVTAQLPVTSPAGPYVLVVNGNLRFGNNSGTDVGGIKTINTSGQSIALIATGNINIHSSIEEINAVLIANGFNLAFNLVGLPNPNSSDPLKINGNLVSNTSVQTWRRDRPDYDKPSLFVVLKPRTYMDLLPLLSSATLSGRQVQ